MASRKINQFSKSNPDTGFGTQSSQIGGRFVNRDGTFNLRKEGLPLYKQLSIYSYLLVVSTWKFILIVIGFFILMNIGFTSLYLLAGYNQLQGMVETDKWGKVLETYFFSTETFTTVGYGRINPIGQFAHFISSFESMTGFMFFAVLTGVLFGRFARPKAYIVFSEKAIISPYHGGVGLMFRMVPFKKHHHLTNAQVTVNLVLMDPEDENKEFKFYSLSLERSRIDSFTMNWTVVHPINKESPLLHFTKEDFKKSEFELYVQVTGFDQTFSNTVMTRTSYTFDELLWGAKFKPMYRESEDGTTTILELHHLNAIEKAELPVSILSD